MASGKPHKSGAESPQLATLSSSVIVLHGLVRPPERLIAAEAEMDVLSHKKKKKKIPQHSSRVVNLPLLLLSRSFTAIFIFCLFLLSCMHNTRLLWLRKELLSLTHPSHAFYNGEGDSPASFSIPTSWHFSLSSINQTPRPAELKKRKKAFEENGRKKKRRLLHWKCSRFGEFPVDSCNKSLGAVIF